MTRPGRGPVGEPGGPQRFAVAFPAALLGYLVTANGFFLGGRPLLAAVLPAAVGALVCRRPALAAVSAANAVAFGTLLFPLPATGLAGGALGAFLSGLLCASLAGVLAWGVAKAIGGPSRRADGAIEIAVLSFLIVGMWYGAIRIDGSRLSGPVTLVAMLDKPVALQAGIPDIDLFRHAIQAAGRGGDYYTAMRDALAAADRFAMVSPTEFRMPTLAWMLAWLPGGAWGWVAACLTLGTAAVIAAFVLGSSLVQRPVALVGAAIVAQMYMRQASGPWLVYSDAWAGAMGLLSLALLSIAMQRGGDSPSRPWLLAAVAAALWAALLREHMLYLPAGLMGIAIVTRAWRSLRAIYWAAVIPIWAVLFALHARAVGISPGALPRTHFHGGLPTLHASITVGQEFLGGAGWLPWILLAGAVLGAAGARPRWRRATMVWAVCAFTALLTVTGPEGMVAGQAPGYWGWMLMPLVGALAPGAFALLPAGRAPARTEP